MPFTILHSLALGALLATLVTGSPIHLSKQCKEYTLTVTTSTLNYIWGLPKLSTNYDATALTSDLGRWDANTTFHPISGAAPATGSYTISGTFCSPAVGGSDTVLLASHGIGFDRSYWDPEFELEKYSFVDYAVARGYSVFYYDRLGVGKSSMVSGYVAQVSIQEAILEQLVAQIRAGNFGEKPKHVVLLGHSFGSVISNDLLVKNPGLVDAAVLTGIGYETPNSAETFLMWQPKLARLQNPFKFGLRDGGYLTWVDIFSNVATFFKQPFYDVGAVQAADANKQPFALMEIITLGIAPLTNNFTGPVMILTGEYDFIFCNGFCGGILLPGAEITFPKSKDLQVYMQPDSGHAINLSLNATGSFGVITDFLAKHGF